MIERINYGLGARRWFVSVEDGSGMAYGGWAATKVGARRLRRKFERWVAP